MNHWEKEPPDNMSKEWSDIIATLEPSESHTIR